MITHLVDNLGHFPLTNGGANLGSLVVEQDDVSGLVADQLSSQLFSAPNIQVRFSKIEGQFIKSTTNLFKCKSRFTIRCFHQSPVKLPLD